MGGYPDRAHPRCDQPGGIGLSCWRSVWSLAAALIRWPERFCRLNSSVPGDTSGCGWCADTACGHSTRVDRPDPGVHARWLFRRIVRVCWHPFLRINRGCKFRPHGHAQFVWLRDLVRAVGQRWRGRGDTPCRRRYSACGRTALARAWDGRCLDRPPAGLHARRLVGQWTRRGLVCADRPGCGRM